MICKENSVCLFVCLSVLLFCCFAVLVLLFCCFAFDVLIDFCFLVFGFWFLVKVKVFVSIGEQTSRLSELPSYEFV